jgi:hypothetical protein
MHAIALRPSVDRAAWLLLLLLQYGVQQQMQHVTCNWSNAANGACLVPQDG